MSQQTSAQNTALGQAFLSAGYKPSPKEPIQIALEAWAKWSSGTGDEARRNYVVQRLRDDMTWKGIEQWQPTILTQFVRWLLDSAKAIIEAERPKRRDAGHKPAAGGGHYQLDNHLSDAPASQPNTRQSRVGEGLGQCSAENHRIRAQPSPPSTAGMAAASAIVHLSILQTIKIEGRAIGDWGAGEARSWARRTGINVRFVEMLTHSLPDTDKISKWIKPHEAEVIWKRAQEEQP